MSSSFGWGAQYASGSHIIDSSFMSGNSFVPFPFKRCFWICFRAASIETFCLSQIAMTQAAEDLETPCWQCTSRVSSGFIFSINLHNVAICLLWGTLSPEIVIPRCTWIGLMSSTSICKNAASGRRSGVGSFGPIEITASYRVAYFFSCFEAAIVVNHIKWAERKIEFGLFSLDMK